MDGHSEFPPIYSKSGLKTPNAPKTKPKRREIYSVPRNFKRKKNTHEAVAFTNSRWENNLLGNWPASSQYQVNSQNRGTSRSYNRRVSLQAKPRLVTELENFLSKELEGVQNEREEYIAFRECFKRFIMSFKTYHPLLFAILHKFDTYIASVENKVREGRKTRTNYSSLKEDMEVQLHLEQRKYVDEKQNLNGIVQQQGDVIGRYKERELLHMSQMEQLERELSDARMDIEEERKRSSILTQALQDSSLENRSLKIKLKEAEAKVKSHSKIQKLYQNSVKRLKNLDDMVPKAQYDKLREETYQYKSLSEKLNQQLRSLRRGNQRMTEDVLSLKLELSSRVENAINDAKLIEKAKAQLKKSYTPRPNWSAAKRLLPQFDHRHSSSHGIAKQLGDYVQKLKDEMVAKQAKLNDVTGILAFLNKKDLISRDHHSNMTDVAFFIGKGTHHRVPRYLRYNGKIKNTRMSKKDVEDTLIDIWENRKKKTRSEFPVFRDYFDDYYEKRTRFPKEKAEIIYNLIRGCERYRYDPDCELFLKVIRGDLSEDCYKDQDRLVDEFEDLFRIIDSETHEGKMTGRVCKNALFERLDMFFKGKSSEDMAEIKTIVSDAEEKMEETEGEDDNKSSIIDLNIPPEKEFPYAQFFVETKDHTQHELIEVIRHQYLIEVEQYSIDIEEAMYNLYKEVQGKSVTVEMIVNKVIKVVDPLRPKELVDEMINYGLDRSRTAKMNIPNLEKRPVNIDKFIKNLKKKVIKRYTKKEMVENAIEEQVKRRYSRSRGMSKKNLFADNSGSGRLSSANSTATSINESMKN